MTFFIIIGMGIMFLIGLWAIAAGLFLMYAPGAIGGSSGRGDIIFGLILIAMGGWFWYYVFSHLQIGFS